MIQTLETDSYHDAMMKSGVYSASSPVSFKVAPMAQAISIARKPTASPVVGYDYSPLRPPTTRRIQAQANDGNLIVGCKADVPAAELYDAVHPGRRQAHSEDLPYYMSRYFEYSDEDREKIAIYSLVVERGYASLTPWECAVLRRYYPEDVKYFAAVGRTEQQKRSSEMAVPTASSSSSSVTAEKRSLISNRYPSHQAALCTLMQNAQREDREVRKDMRMRSHNGGIHVCQVGDHKNAPYKPSPDSVQYHVLLPETFSGVASFKTATIPVSSFPVETRERFQVFYWINLFRKEKQEEDKRKEECQGVLYEFMAHSGIKREEREVQQRVSARRRAVLERKATKTKNERAEEVSVARRRANDLETELTFEAQSGIIGTGIRALAAVGGFLIAKRAARSLAKDAFTSVLECVSQQIQNIRTAVKKVLWVPIVIMLAWYFRGMLKLPVAIMAFAAAFSRFLPSRFREVIANIFGATPDEVRSCIKPDGELEIPPERETTDFTAESGIANPATLLASLFCMSAFNEKKPRESHVESFMKRVSYFDRMRGGLDSFIKWLLESLQDLCNFGRKLFGKEQIDFLRKQSTPFQKWTDSVRAATAKCRTNSVEENPALVEELLELVRTGTTFRSLYKDTDAAPLVERTFKEAVDLAAPYLAAASPNAGIRQEPVSVILAGAPGIGKTTMIPMFCGTLLVLSGLLPRDSFTGNQDKDAHMIKSNVFQKGPSKYWNGYAGQAIYVKDDIFCKRAVPGEQDSDYVDVIKIVSGHSSALDMADLNSKGRIHFTSKLFLSTTNLVSFTTEAEKVIIDMEALIRRFHLPYYVTLKPEYARNDKLDVLKFNEEMDLCRSRQPDSIFDLFPWHIWEAVEWDFGRGMAKSAETISMKRLLQLAADRLRTHTMLFEQTNANMRNLAGFVNFHVPPTNTEFKAQSGSSAGSLPRSVATSVDDSETYGELEEDLRNESSSESEVDEDGCSVKLSRKHSTTVLARHRANLVLRMGRQYTDVWTKLNHYMCEVDKGKLKDLQSRVSAFDVVVHAFNAMDDMLLHAASEARQATDDRAVDWQTSLHDLGEAVLPAFRYLTAEEDMLKAAVDGAPLDKTRFGKLADVILSFVTDTLPTTILGLINFAFQCLHKLEVAASASFNRLNAIGDAVRALVSRSASRFLVWHSRLNAVAKVSTCLLGISAVLFVAAKALKAVVRFFCGRKDYDQHSNRPEPKRPVMRSRPVDIPRKAYIEQSNKLRDTTIQNKVYNNTYKLYIQRDDEDRQVLGQALFVNGRLAVMPAHFLKSMAEACAGHDGDIICLKPVTGADTIRMSYKAFADCPKHVVQDRDMVFIMFNTRAHATLDAYLIRERDVNYVCNKTALVCGYNIQTSRGVPDSGVANFMPTFQLNVRKNVRNSGNPVSRVWCYYSCNTAGDCGAPLINVESDTFGCRQLIGYHIGGSLEGSRTAGIGAILTIEDVELAKRVLQPNGFINDKFKEDAAKFLPKFGIDFKEEAGGPMNYGSFRQVGVVSKNATMCRQTSYFKTDVFGRFGDSDLAPAHMRPVELEGVKVDPLDNARAPYSSALLTYDQSFIRPCACAAVQPLFQATAQCTREIFSFEKAVVGIPEAKFRAIPRGTGAGYPYNQTFKDGKRQLFGDGDEFDFNTEGAKFVRDRVDYIIGEAKQGNRCAHVFHDFLKDELRSKKKNDVAATRLISAAPIDYVIAWRMYFGAFTSACMQNPVATGMAPGICAYSDWGKVVRHVTRKGQRVFDGDFKGFDASEMPSILYIILDIVNKWYSLGDDYDSSDDLVRRVLFEDLVNSRHIGGKWDPVTGQYNLINCIYQWLKSLPSGHPFTTIVNSLYSLIILACAVYILTGNFDIWADVSLLTYGDDNLVNPSDGVAGVVTQEAISGVLRRFFGLIYTPGSKDGSWLIDSTIFDVTFLKRAFRFSRENAVLAPLELDSFLYTPYWCKNKREVSKIISDNLEMVLCELSLHDEDAWNTYSPLVCRVMNERGQSPIFFDQQSYRNMMMERTDDWY